MSCLPLLDLTRHTRPRADRELDQAHLVRSQSSCSISCHLKTDKPFSLKQVLLRVSLQTDAGPAGPHLTAFPSLPLC